MKKINPWEQIYRSFAKNEPLSKHIPAPLQRAMIQSLSDKQLSFTGRARKISDDTIMDQRPLLLNDPHDKAQSTDTGTHTCWINDVKLSINPTKIKVSQETYAVKSHTLRSAGSTKVPGGRAVWYLSMAITFVGEEEINTKLRRLIAQARLLPLFTIRNEFVGQNINPENPQVALMFAVTGVNITAHSRAHDAIEVNFSMEFFNHQPFTQEIMFMATEINTQSPLTPSTNPTKAGPSPAPNLTESQNRLVLTGHSDPGISTSFYKRYFDTILQLGAKDAVKENLERLQSSRYMTDKELKKFEEELKSTLKQSEEAARDLGLSIGSMVETSGWKNFVPLTISNIRKSNFKLSYWKYIFLPDEVANAIQAEALQQEKNFQALLNQGREGAANSVISFPTQFRRQKAEEVINVAKTLGVNSQKHGATAKEAHALRVAGAGRRASADDFYYDCSLYTWDVLRRSVGLDLGPWNNYANKGQIPSLDQIHSKIGSQEYRNFAPILRIGSKEIPLPFVRLTAPAGSTFPFGRTTLISNIAALTPAILHYQFDTEKDKVRCTHSAISGKGTFEEKKITWYEKGIWTGGEHQSTYTRTSSLITNIGAEEKANLETPKKKDKVYHLAYLIPGVTYDLTPELLAALMLSPSAEGVIQEILKLAPAIEGRAREFLNSLPESMVAGVKKGPTTSPESAGDFIEKHLKYFLRSKNPHGAAGLYRLEHKDVSAPPKQDPLVFYQELKSVLGNKNHPNHDRWKSIWISNGLVKPDDSLETIQREAQKYLMAYSNSIQDSSLPSKETKDARELIRAKIGALQSEEVHRRNALSKIAEELYRRYVKSMEAWKASHPDWEMIFTSDGVALLRKKVSIDLGTGTHAVDSSLRLNTIDPQFVSATTTNLFARLPLLGHSTIAHQHLGSNDLEAHVQFALTGDLFLSRLQSIQKYNQELVNKFRRIPDAGVIQIENEILNLAGSSSFFIDSLEVTTHPDSPGASLVTMKLTEWVMRQRHREEIQQEKYQTKDQRLAFLKKFVSEAMSRLRFDPKAREWLFRLDQKDVSLDNVTRQDNGKTWIIMNKSSLTSLLGNNLWYQNLEEQKPDVIQRITREDRVLLACAVLIATYLETIRDDVPFLALGLMKPKLSTTFPAYLVGGALSPQAKSLFNDDQGLKNPFYLYGAWSDEIFKDLVTPLSFSPTEGLRFEKGGLIDSFISKWNRPTLSRPTLNKFVTVAGTGIDRFFSSLSTAYGETTQSLSSIIPNTLYSLIISNPDFFLKEIPKEVEANQNEWVKISGLNREDAIRKQFAGMSGLASLAQLFRDDLSRLAVFAINVLKAYPRWSDFGEDSKLAIQLRGMPAYQDIPLPIVTAKSPKNPRETLFHYFNPGDFWWTKKIDAHSVEKLLYFGDQAWKDTFLATNALGHSLSVWPTDGITSFDQNRFPIGMVGPLAAQGKRGGPGSNLLGGLFNERTEKEEPLIQLNNLPDSFSAFGVFPQSLVHVSPRGVTESGLVIGRSEQGSRSSPVSNDKASGTGPDVASLKKADPSWKAELDKRTTADRVIFGPYGYSQIQVPVFQDTRPEWNITTLKNAVSESAQERLGMGRVFPTFKLYFIEDDTSSDGKDPITKIRSFDDFFSYNALKEIRCVSSRKYPASTLVVRMANLFGNLDNLEFSNAPPNEPDSPIGPVTSEKLSEKTNELLDTNLENPFQKLVLKEGMKVQLKLGYDNDPSKLPVVFNGQIAEVNVNGLDEIIIVCQSFGTQLVAEPKGISGDAPYQWTDTFELLSWLMCQPEMLSFGRWAPDLVQTLAESRASGAKELIFKFLSTPADDNIYAPQRHQIVSKYADVKGGFLSSLMGNMWQAINAKVATPSTSPNVQASLTNRSGSIDAKLTVISRLKNFYLYKFEAKNLPMLSWDDDKKKFDFKPISVVTPFSSDQKNQTTVNLTSTNARGKSGLLDYLVFRTRAWDVFKEMELRHPGWISHPVPYGDRMTMFFGLPTQMYWARPPSEEEQKEIQANQAALSKTVFNLNSKDGLRAALIDQYRQPSTLTKVYEWYKNSFVGRVYDKHWVAINAATLLIPGGLKIQSLGKGLSAALAWYAGRGALFRGAAAILTGGLSMTVASAVTLTNGVVTASRFGKVALTAAGVLGAQSLTSVLIERATSAHQQIFNSIIYQHSLQEIARKEMLRHMETGRFRPFRSYHLITSEKDIVANSLKCSSHGIYNAVTLEYTEDENAEIKPGSSQFTTATLRASYDILDKDIRMVFHTYPNCKTRWMADRYMQGLLMRHLKDMYRGTITIIGKPTVKPYDMLFISDNYTGIQGRVEVEEVIHTYTPETGFLTEITPDFCVSGNDILNLPYDDFESYRQVYQEYEGKSIMENLHILSKNANEVRRKLEQKQEANADAAASNFLNTSPKGEVSAFTSVATTIGTVGALGLAVGGAPVSAGAAGLVALTSYASSWIFSKYHELKKTSAWKMLSWSTQRQPLIFHPLYLNGRPLMAGIPIERTTILQKIKENFVPYVMNMAKGFSLTSQSLADTYFDNLMQFVGKGVIDSK